MPVCCVRWSLVAAPVRLREGIVLDGVSFRYESGGADVLSDVSLRVPAGSVVAVVGDNGAGKTTLVKLLTGMYRPTAGSITIDGIPLDRVDLEDWRQRCSAAFQDGARFELTVQQAVGVGDLPRLDDAEAVRAALDRAGSGSLPSTLDAGLGTRLGMSFDDGTQLSGGQWQKLSLGRSMMRASPLLLVFDEPTAHLDPDAERALFATWASRARQTAADHGTITFIVSHRFSTVRMADLIVVLGDHGVAEYGTRAELIAHGGLYSELYTLQAAGYR